VFNSSVKGAKNYTFHVASTTACYLLHAGSLLGIFFDPEDGDNIFL
jgi:hypothetical protein